MKKEIIALYANKSNALVKGTKCRISDDARIVPLQEEGVTMVPLPFFADSIGGTVTRDAGNAALVLACQGKTITLKPGDKTITVNGQCVEIAQSPFLKHDICYIPLEDLCESLGLYCFSDDSGLILYSEQQLNLSWTRDGAFLRKTAESFIYDDADGAEIVRLIREKHPNQGHPRMIMTEEKFAAIRANLASDDPDPFYKKLFQKVKAQADACLYKRATGYEIRDGVRLIYVSSEIKDKVFALAMTYQLTLDDKYAERAWLEMYNASCFVDWHPWHMLDTGILTTALAFGYDWLYHWLDEGQRRILREAMVVNGFSALANDYNGLTVVGDDHRNPLHRSWYWRGGNPVNNWRFIAGGGVATGAIAIADELSGKDLEMCEQILSQSLIDIREPLSLFAPAGAYPEGINYWSFAMSYFTLHIGSLLTAAGKDFGYTDVPGIRHTADFVLAVNGTASVFNYGDAGRAAASMGWPVMFLMHLYGDQEDTRASVQAAAQARINLILKKSNGCTEDFLYYIPAFAQTDGNCSVSLDTYLQDSEVFAARSGFDADDTYIALQCGDNFADHGQYDMGTFVLDAMGENFFLDLGADNYNLPNRFTDAYRYRAEGHNTIVINPDMTAGQIFESTAFIDRHASAPDGAFAISDITSAYAHQARSIRRGIRLDHNRRMSTVQDEVRLTEISDFWWFAHTDAEITVSEDGRSAYLTKHGKTLLAEITSGDHAAFTVMDAQPMESSPKVAGQATNEGIRKLVIHIPECLDLDLAVTFKNYDAQYRAEDFCNRFVPLDQWNL